MPESDSHQFDLNMQYQCLVCNDMVAGDQAGLASTTLADLPEIEPLE
jgi:hypothetical protein